MYANANAALLAAIIYLANPYMLFTAYERTAYAELLAAAWIPLLFHAILRDRITDSAHRAACRAAMAHQCARSRDGQLHAGAARDPPDHCHVSKPVSTACMATRTGDLRRNTLGLALAAFYIVPAAYERRFVQIAMATITGMRIDQNFLFEHTGSSADELLHDQVLHTASIIAVVLLAATAIALAASVMMCKSGPPKPAFPALQLAILSAGIAFLLTPLSLPVWDHAPQAVFLQFTWRLLAILAPVFALATAAALDRFKLALIPTVVAAIILAVSLSHPAYSQFRQPCDDEDTPPARLALFHANSGTDPTDEYTPVGADNDALAPNLPPDWLAAKPDDPPPSAAVSGPVPMHLELTAPHDEDLILNLRDYPAWYIFLDNQPDFMRMHRPDGLIAIPVPAGTSTVDIRYTHMPDETIGDAISLLALGFLFVAQGRRNRGPNLTDHESRR